MTKALEHILRNGKRDIEMGLLSKHKHLDTTKNHYIELELEKMLEATYGITIGSANIDATSKIVDHIPDSASSAQPKAVTTSKTWSLLKTFTRPISKPFIESRSLLYDSL